MRTIMTASMMMLIAVTGALATEPIGSETIISEPTKDLLPGDRLLLGRITDMRSEQFEVDIGNPNPLYLPVKPAKQKGQRFEIGQLIVVTMNDHNAVVDYHHPDADSRHQVFRGRLSTPLTVGLDKAVIATERRGTQTFMVAERAKGKLTAMPVGADVLFLADETGRLVDAQLASREAVRESGHNNKARLLGAHEQVRGVFKGTDHNGHLTIIEKGRDREMPIRPPLKKLEHLHPGQEVVLLTDDQGYVLDIASPALPPD
jgi:hypothetical protein